MKSKFSAIHREYSPNPRKFYAFCTSVTDTTTTSGIIASGKESFTVHGMLTLTFVFFSVLRHLSVITRFGSGYYSERYGDTPTSETV